MPDDTLKLPFATWLKATELLASAGKTLSDNDLRIALDLPSLKVARQVRRQVRIALRSRTVPIPAAPLESEQHDRPAKPGSGKKREPDAAVPPISEWYAPHMM